MKIRLFAIGALALLAFSGCSKGEETPTVDPATAKAQPGANTPPASAAPGAPSETQLRAEKEGK